MNNLKRNLFFILIFYIGWKISKMIYLLSVGDISSVISSAIGFIFNLALVYSFILYRREPIMKNYIFFIILLLINIFSFLYLVLYY